MAVGFKVKFPPHPKVLNVQEWQREYQHASVQATYIAGFRLRSEVISRTPRQTGRTGDSAMVDVVVQGQTVKGLVGSAKKEALFIEEGTGPQHIGAGGAQPAYWPPIRRLRLWARRVVGDERFAYYLQRKIRGWIPGRLGGTPAFRPYELAAKQTEHEVIGVYERAYAALANRISS